MGNLNLSKKLSEKHLGILSEIPLFRLDEDDMIEPPVDHVQIVTDYELGMQQIMLDYQYKLGVLSTFVNSKFAELNKRIKIESKVKVEEVKVKTSGSKAKSPVNVSKR